MATPAAETASVPTAAAVETVQVDKVEEKPADHNPEALEDVSRPAPEVPADARFQNVDLEAGGGAAAAPPAAAAATSPLDKSAITEMADHMDWGVTNLMLTFCLLVVMISASTVCGGGVSIGNFPIPGSACTGINGYQVAYGTIGAVVGIVTVALNYGSKLTPVVQEGISIFQWLWSLTGMIVLTFFGSFQNLAFANGYFATWLALFFASLTLIQTSQMFKRTVDSAAHSARSPLLCLVISSAVVMGASIGYCSPAANCVSYNAFALSLGTISLIISIVLVFAAARITEKVMQGIAVFLFAWWTLGFCIVTFGGPFVTAGNGYFAALGSIMASFALLASVTRK